MSYEIKFKPAALRQLRKLPRNIQEAIILAADNLTIDPSFLLFDVESHELAKMAS